jgi:thiol-disulfide isomerase/thioredoxin
MKKHFAFVSAAIALAVFCAAGFGLGEASAAKSLAPDFSVRDPEGRTVKLSDLRGKPAVVNFWASWCPPCRSEMPRFEAMYKELGGEVNFMMIDLPGGGETKSAAENFLAENGFTFPVYYDDAGEGMSAYGINAIPMSLFIDKDGYLVSKSIGSISLEKLKSGIAEARK